jgi:hypothetical protein
VFRWTIRDILVNPRGFGAALLGNMFRDIPDDEAAATVDAAREQRAILRHGGAARAFGGCNCGGGHHNVYLQRHFVEFRFNV